jgi:uncharacterized protein YjlB
VEKLTGLARPSWPEVEKAVRVRKPHLVNFDDDGLIPNSPLPLVIYRGDVGLTKTNDPAALFEVLFAHCGWKGSWRNGIYDFAHYHSRTHEVLGLAHGKVLVRFGGARGRVIELKAGDVAILPAGTGHERIEASADLLVVGAYTSPKLYDECRASKEHDAAAKRIARVAPPKQDPVFGSDGPLMRAWKGRSTSR